MHYARSQIAASPFDEPRDFLLFPDCIRRDIGRPIAMATMVLLLSVGSGVVHAVRAEPLFAVQSRSEPAAPPYANHVAEAAQRFGIPSLWINAVIVHESAGDMRAVSSQGAMGLMQIMPDTWADLRFRYGLGVDPFDPRDNILAGAAYLREMHDRYGSPGFLAAYNAGPERYEEYLTTGRALPGETQLYVAALAPRIGAQQVGGTVAIARRAIPWQESSLFATREPHGGLAQLSALSSSDRASVGLSVDGQPALQPRPDGLFVNPTHARPLQ